MFGGPIIGGIAGAVGGVVAAFEFGFSKGNFVTGFGLPLGKALTGITAGYLFRRFNVDSWIRAPLLTLISYIPEAILTVVLFRYLLPPLTGLPVGIAALISYQIVVKACIEMVILGLLLKQVINNKGIKVYAENYFH